MKKLSPKQREALLLIAEGRFYPDFVREEDGWHARWQALGTDNPWIDAMVREAVQTPLTRDAEEQRHETLHDAWLMALRSATGLVRWDEAACADFAAEVRDWNGTAAEDRAARETLVFTLVAGTGPDRTGFFLRCLRPHGRRALRALGQAAFVFPPLRSLQTEGDHLAMALTRAEAESFLRSGARELNGAGYRVAGIDLSADVQAEVDVAAPAAPAAQQGKAALKLTVRVAGEVVSAQEIRFLLDQKSTLVFFRNRWIEVDRNILKEALRALERAEGRVLTTNEALGFASGIGAVGRLEIARARAHGWLRGLINELRRAVTQGAPAAEPVPSAVPDALRETLRPYQRRGVAWIRFLTDHGFGALLADDMGLGKTLQTIAWILGCPAEPGRPFLIVAPLTLVSNWRHEFARFAPQAKVYVHQGEGRQLELGFRRAVAGADVVVTSYSLLVRDYAILRKTAWCGLVLDEAQVIKNPDTQVARAARALGVPRRLALTGTPVENTVADLWSLEEFLNPGFLADRKTFAERFVKPMALDERSAAGRRLRHALEPFVLRRLKSDAEVAGELGEKREIKEYCVLSPAQRADYETALAEYRASARQQGDVFTLITRLKLICDGAGKFERLVELLQAIFAAGESALVFTQYAKVGAQLKAALAKRLGYEFPFLHGGLTARQREAAIAAFVSGGLAGETGAASPNCFLLSLRAGGYGLNLVKATHVIHFDRWWNPAVEAQATDRAHRIGQTGTVFVHSFITEGTLEEHVDEILERKSRVAGALVTSGESFLLQLSDEELGAVLALS